MYKLTLATLLLAATTTLSFAVEDSSISSKAMRDQPGTMGGTTANPTAKASDGNLTTKAMKELPGTSGGSTGAPTAAAEDGNLTTKAMRDLPGTR